MHSRVIKVCGITRAEDARAAVEAGANALGFNFYARSSRVVSVECAAEIGAGLPAHVWKVGVFVNEPPESVRSIARRAGLDVVQLHGEETSSDVPENVRVWKAFPGTRDELAALLDAFPAEAFLLDAPCAGRGGSGQTFDWSKIKGLKQRIILAGGLDAVNVREAIRQVQPWGVDSCSRIESAPGIKDHDKMKRFIEAARMEMQL